MQAMVVWKDNVRWLEGRKVNYRSSIPADAEARERAAEVGLFRQQKEQQGLVTKAKVDFLSLSSFFCPASNKRIISPSLPLFQSPTGEIRAEGIVIKMGEMGKEMPSGSQTEWTFISYFSQVRDQNNRAHVLILGNSTSTLGSFQFLLNYLVLVTPNRNGITFPVRKTDNFYSDNTNNTSILYGLYNFQHVCTSILAFIHRQPINR